MTGGAAVDRRIPRRALGASGLCVGAIGVGTWQWRAAAASGGPDGRAPSDIPGAYAAALDAGADFLDTAEIYGRGQSERLIGALRAGDPRPAVVATKYFPALRRWRLGCVDAAIDASLARLGVDQIDLYQVHWPHGPIPHRRLLLRLARAVHDGRLRGLGVSNFTAAQMRRAQALLAAEGVPLTSNQVAYSLLRRAPETNGVLDACHELGVTLIAYSPLAQGVLTDSAGAESRRQRSRGFARVLGVPAPNQAAAVLAAARRVGQAMGASVSQVALAWTLRDPLVLPIVGVRTPAHAAASLQAAHLTLAADARRDLDAASRQYRRADWLRRRLVG